MQLRDYQQACIDSLWRFWRERPGENPLTVLPTGAGKTVIASKAIQGVQEASGGKANILFLAHRQELITQTEEKLRTVWPDAPTGVYAASVGRKEFAPITIASRDTLVRALNKCPPFHLAIIDEAHNISPKEESSYQKIVRTLKAKHDRVNFWGLTATPFRTGSGLIYGGEDSLFSDVAFRISLIELIKRGYLAPVRAKRIHGGIIDTRGIKTVAGDFSNKELAARAEDIKLVNAALDDWCELAADRHVSLFFCVSVKHARLVSDALYLRGYKCPLIHGGTPKQQRDAVFAAARARMIDGIVNVGVATEGTDIPAVDCIVMLRPTQSLGLYIQMVGRGMRLCEDKSDCLLLDYGGCIDRFGPIDIAAPPVRRNKNKVRTKVCPICNEVLSVFARKCHSCGAVFEPPAVKDCPACGTANPVSAKECMACGKLFVDHYVKAAEGAVLSIDLKTEIRHEYVYLIKAKAKVSKNNNPYLLVTFIYGVGSSAHLSLMIGYPGLAGKKAETIWRKLSNPTVPVPKSVEEAEALAQSGFKKGVWITLEIRGNQKSVIAVNLEKPKEEAEVQNELNIRTNPAATN